MRRTNFLAMLALALITVFTPATADAQTPEATPGASVGAAGDNWQVTDVREITVDGEPFALSPDGQWLAGTRGEDHDEVCAWDIETLAPSCAEVKLPVQPYTGGSAAMRWSSDSSAFAFVEGNLAWRTTGDAYVFDVATGELTNLTNTGGAEGDGPIYVGADWAGDGEQVVFGVNHGLGDSSPPDEIVRVDRSGGDPVEVPLPDWSGAYNLLFPPFVAEDAVFVAIDAETAIGGIWRVGLDGSDPRQVVMANGDPPVAFPMIVSGSPDGRYLNVISVTGFRLMLEEETFFLFNASTGELLPLVSKGDLNFITFAPDGDIGLVVREVHGEDRLHMLDLSTGEVIPVANSPEVDVWLETVPGWAENNTIFLPDGEGGTLINLAPAS